MGIEVSWIDDSHTGILVEFKGKWTWDDMRSANEKTSEMVKSVSYAVDTVNDLTHSAGLPSGALTEGRAMMNGFESGDGLMLVVQAGGFVKSLYNVFQKLYGRRAGFPETHFFDTREDAFAYLREQRGASQGE
jgi:hypothetical protein